MPVYRVILAAAFAVISPCAHAQTSPPTDPAADLAAMQKKAETSQQARQFMLIARETGTGGRTDDRLRMILLDRMGLRNQQLDGTINIEAAGQIDRATQRGQYVGQILSADLDGDWSVTIAELQNALQLQSLNGAAEVFVLSDANSDGVLSTEEIKAGADKMATRREGRRERNTEILALFDFDGDGLVTPEELERGLNALSPNP